MLLRRRRLTNFAEARGSRVYKHLCIQSLLQSSKSEGRRRQTTTMYKEIPWTEDEEKALRDGIRKHGAGKWRKILNDPDLAVHLVIRDRNDLKVKWRASPYTLPVVVNEPSPNESRLDATVIDAIATINDEDGSDFNSILSYIQERYELQLYRYGPLLDSLRRLTFQGKLIRIKNRYKIPPYVKSEATPDEVARLLAEQAHKTLLAEEAAREVEYAEKLAADSLAILELAEEMREQCQNGEIIPIE